MNLAFSSPVVQLLIWNAVRPYSKVKKGKETHPDGELRPVHRGEPQSASVDRAWCECQAYYPMVQNVPLVFTDSWRTQVPGELSVGRADRGNTQTNDLHFMDEETEAQRGQKRLCLSQPAWKMASSGLRGRSVLFSLINMISLALWCSFPSPVTCSGQSFLGSLSPVLNRNDLSSPKPN